MFSVNVALLIVLQVAGLISALMVLIVIVAVGPLLQPLQKVCERERDILCINDYDFADWLP